MANWAINEDKLRCEGGTPVSPYGVSYEVVTDLVTEPVTLSEFKQHARIDYATDDALCLTYIRAAREYLEQFTQKSFGPKTMRISYLSLPGNHQLMYGPVTGTTSDITLEGDYVTEAQLTPGSFEYSAGYDVLPMVLKVAIMKYAAGMYMLRENVVISDNGSVQDPFDLLDDAEKLAAKYANVIWF